MKIYNFIKKKKKKQEEKMIIFLSFSFSSTMSTGLNSMSGVIYEDMIKPWLRIPLSEIAVSRLMKLTVVLTGILCVTLVFLVEKLGGLIQVHLQTFFLWFCHIILNYFKLFKILFIILSYNFSYLNSYNYTSGLFFIIYIFKIYIFSY